MRKVICLLSTLLILSVAGCVTPGVELVKGGKPVAEIVIAKDHNQSVKLAAKDLQGYLKKISGAELKIVDAPTTEVKNQIYVGESEFTRKLGFEPAKFNNSGLEIVAKGNYVILSGTDRLSKKSPFASDLKKWQEFCGEKFGFNRVTNGGGAVNYPLGIHTNDDTGTWYAASELLEQLGVRFYAPYDNGTVIPEMKDVSVAEQNFKSEAAFENREWCYYQPMRTDEEGVSWLKRMKCGNHTTIILNHLTNDIYASKEQHELHPEYLACDAQGKPYPGYPVGYGMPRFGNQDFRRASTVYMNKMLEVFPEVSAICMGQPDGSIKIDARDIGLYGKEGDSDEQRIANCLWEYNVYLAKELKKSYPDKFLIYMVYGAGGCTLPTNMKSDDPDNIITLFCYAGAYRVLKNKDKAILEEHQKWLSHLKPRGKCPVWDYYLDYSRPTHPRFPIFFTESLQNEMKEMQPYSRGKFIELQPAYESSGSTKGKDGDRIGVTAIMNLTVYWQSKLLWNPNLDRKATLEEYYKLFFGPAAAEMKEFHEFAEEVWCRQGSRSVTQTTGFLKEADVDKYFEILARARAKAGKDTVYDKRIAAMEQDYQPLKKLFSNLQRKGGDISAYVVPNDIKLDGDVAKYKNGWRSLCDRATGSIPPLNRTDVSISFSKDRAALYIAAICYDNKMDKIKASNKSDDTASIFDDDVIEVYINTPERSYFKIVVNPNGSIWDESTDVSIIERDTLPILWNPGTKAVVKKYNDRWTMELMIPTKDFGKLGPTKQYPWGIQVARSRYAEGNEEWSLSTGGNLYATLSEWCNLILRE